MKVQHTVSVLFTLPEYHLIGRLLDQQPSRKLNPALTKLQDGIAQALDAGVQELAVDFPQDALYALSSLLMQQDGLSLENRGINAEFAYSVAKGLTDAFALLLRTEAGPLTRGEKSDVSDLLRNYSYYPPLPTVPSFEEIARQLFGDSAVAFSDGVGVIDTSGIGADDEVSAPTAEEIADADPCDCPLCRPQSDPSLN